MDVVNFRLPGPARKKAITQINLKAETEDIELIDLLRKRWAESGQSTPTRQQVLLAACRICAAEMNRQKAQQPGPAGDGESLVAREPSQGQEQPLEHSQGQETHVSPVVCSTCESCPAGKSYRCASCQRTLAKTHASATLYASRQALFIYQDGTELLKEEKPRKGNRRQDRAQPGRENTPGVKS